MNVLYPKALTLLRVVAISFILPGMLVPAAYILHARRDHVPVQPLHCLSLSIPLVMGVIILLKSPAWARRLTQDFDE